MVTRKCLYCWGDYETSMIHVWIPGNYHSPEREAWRGHYSNELTPQRYTCSKSCASRQSAWSRWIHNSRLVAMGCVDGPSSASHLQPAGQSLFTAIEFAAVAS